MVKQRGSLFVIWLLVKSVHTLLMLLCWQQVDTPMCSSSLQTQWAVMLLQLGVLPNAVRCLLNPCYCQIHPTCIPQAGDYQSKLTLMSESLRNDGRVWVPKSAEVAAKVRSGDVQPKDIAAESDRDYYLERRYPTFGNLVPRDVASRAAKKECDDGKGVARSEKGYGVFLDFAAAIERYGKIEANKRGVGADNASAKQVQEWGADVVKAKYGNLFEMYERITGDNPYETPMRIYPAPHYTMGGLWVDYNLQSNVSLVSFVIGEANFSDHGANRLGASALMQGLADGYFVLPYTIGHYLAQTTPGFTDNAREEFEASKAGGNRTITKDSFNQRNKVL